MWGFGLTVSCVFVLRVIRELQECRDWKDLGYKSILNSLTHIIYLNKTEVNITSVYFLFIFQGLPGEPGFPGPPGLPVMLNLETIRVYLLESKPWDGNTVIYFSGTSWTWGTNRPTRIPRLQWDKGINFYSVISCILISIVRNYTPVKVGSKIRSCI